MAVKQVMVVPSFHCDVVWRRPPDEQVAIRARQFDTALEMLEKCPEFRFEFDQASIMREYLEAHPERLEQVRRFLGEGRLDVTGGEEAIPDTNMVSGEGLVRNIFLGRLWFEEELGACPVVANMDDAFGLSAQLPQIFVGFGYRYFRGGRTAGLDPDVARNGIMWEGLDGSRIFSAPSHQALQTHTHVCNLPIVYRPMERARHSLGLAVGLDLPVVYCSYGSEEDLVTDDVVQLVLDFAPPEGTTVKFALAREVLEELHRRLPSPPVVRGEFNPSQPGTHITRISLKKAYRQAEWATICAEAAAACAALEGSPYPGDQLAGMWRKLAYVQFHDSLCGCHIDSVNHRVMGYCQDVAEAARAMGDRALLSMFPRGGQDPHVLAFNPLPFPRTEPVWLPLPGDGSIADSTGQPMPAERHGDSTLVVADLPAMGTSQWRIVKAKVAKPEVRPGEQASGEAFQVGPYAVTPKDDGVRISHSSWGRTLVSGSFPQVRFRLEDGTLWDERFLGLTFTDEAGQQRLARREDGDVSVRLLWQGEVRGEPAADPLPPVWKATRDGKPVVFSDLKRLHWEKELVFYRELDRIECAVRLDWEGKNTEILVGFPLQLDLARARAVYDVPFGAMERKPYFEVPFSSPEREGAPLHLAELGGKGAWPALTWVAYGDDEWGMVLANQGTPSHRLMSGMIEVGVLRSPTTKSSGFNAPVSARENGHHEFRFALVPFLRDWRNGQAYRLGACFNAAPLVQVLNAEPAREPARSYLELNAPGVAFSAWKAAERGGGYVLRTFETEGRATSGGILTKFLPARVHELDLMERPVRQVDPERLSWRPFEIKTLLLQLQP